MGICVGIALFLFATSDPVGDSARFPASEPRAICHPIEFFTRENCRQCLAAEEFLDGLAQRRPDVRIKRHDVLKDPQSLKRLYEICRKHRIETAGVPGLLVANRLFIGYKDDEKTGKRIEELLTIEVFTRAACPHCAKAKEFLSELANRHPGLRIVVSDVVKDAAAMTRMHDLAKRHHVQVPSLPMFWIYGHVIVGYRGADSTGRELEKLVIGATIPCPDPAADIAPPLNAQQTQVAMAHNEMGLLNSHGVPCLIAYRPPASLFYFAAEEPIDIVPEGIPALNEDAIAESAEPQEHSAEPAAAADAVEIPLFGMLRVSDVGLPTFTLLLGLVDGFNPCAMWVLLFLLSVLVNLKDRRKIIAIAGTFVIVSGLAYFAFMAAWLNVFVLIGFARWAQIGLGMLATVIGAVNIKDFCAFGRGLSFSIPESAKPGIYARVRQIVSAQYLTAAILGAIVLAVLVNTVEILCTAGLPALYTQILMFRQLPWWKNYAYLALYNAAYMFDDSIILTLAVVTLSHRKLQEREGRWLKLVSGLVILGLGLLLLFHPDSLA